MRNRLVALDQGHTATLIEHSPRVHCAASAATVQRELLEQTGVIEVRPDPVTGEVTVTYRPDLVDSAVTRAALTGSAPPPVTEPISTATSSPVDEAVALYFAGVPVGTLLLIAAAGYMMSMHLGGHGAHALINRWGFLSRRGPVGRLGSELPRIVD